MDIDNDDYDLIKAMSGSSDVVVGIVDTGADINHPDLKDNLWTNPGEIPGDGIDNDGNGFVDDVHGWNFQDNTNDLTDLYDHGTHVAGTIGAVGNNGKGVSGINMNVKLAILKYYSTVGYTSSTVSAVQYANAMGIDITTHSHGGYGFSQAMKNALSERGIHICGAGNDAKDTDKSPFYPACYDLDNVISVASTDSYDNMSSFSNYGAKTIDLAAPGSGIYSTTPNGSYGFKSGTSMATPHVTGAVALLKSYYKDYTPEQLKAAILDNVDPIQCLTGKTVTGGRLNVAKAFGVVTEYQGVDYKDVYNYDFYKNSYQDVYYSHNSSPLEALKHFVETGMADGRPASDEFSPRAYQKRYKDLRDQYGSDWTQYYLHYINTGKAEGRIGKTEFRPGDVNGDGVMDQGDLRSMTSAIHFYSLAKSEGNRWYKPEADMDYDMDIDNDDYEDLEIRIKDLAMPVTLLGDVNKDGEITYADLNSIIGAMRAYAMGRSEHSSNVVYTPEADLDRDGDVDSDDYDILKSMIG